MNYYTPPFSDFPLSRIALGCMSFHDLAAGRAIIGAALDLGINFFDTADLYDKGENERIVGRALQGLRQKVFIATKVGKRGKWIIDIVSHLLNCLYLTWRNPQFR